MKSTGFAVVLLLTVAAFVTWNSLYVSSEIDGIRETVLRIPEPGEGTEADLAGGAAICREVGRKWEKVFPYLTYVCSYQELNRADDAVLELEAAYRTKSRDGIAAARGKLLDSLRRLIELEGLTPGGIF